VIVPVGITAQLSEADRKQLVEKCEELCASLKKGGIRASGDYRDNYSPGWKFNHWELKVERKEKFVCHYHVFTCMLDT